MDFIMSSILQLVAILSTISQRTCQETENFTMIYATKGQVFSRDSGVHSIPRELINLNGSVTDLKINQGFLYASVYQKTPPDSKVNEIWRVRLSNSTGFEVDQNSWTRLQVNTSKIITTSMVVVNGSIYAGRADGFVWRCSADEPNSCEDFNAIVGFILELDYSPMDGNIYMTKWNPKNDENSFSVTRCTLDGFCERVESLDNISATSVKAAFGKIWIGTKTSKLWSCSVSRNGGSSDSTDDNCEIFYEFDQSSSMKVSASNDYLYVNFKPHNGIWRCDPNVMKSCVRVLQTSDSIPVNPFIIV